MGKSVVGKKTFDFNNDGLAHVGMLPDLIADLERLGLTAKDLDPLLGSAEGYIQLWERVWSQRVRPNDIFAPDYETFGEGIASYDLSDPADRIIPFDYGGTGKLDHLLLYRPGTGTVWILERSSSGFSAVYAEGSPGQGIGGYDLGDPADRIIPFDYGGTGKLKEVVAYRPEAGMLSILGRR
jgi:hypothetical protein